MPVPGLLADHTSLRVGGPADAWVVARTRAEAVRAVSEADSAGQRVLVLGGGSNLLVADTGFRGVVVELATRGVGTSVEPERVSLQLEAGESWDDVVAMAVAEGWSGIEALSGIPGRVGATPVQNVGAYGQDVSGVLDSVTVLDRATGAVGTLGADACLFGYRTSAFKRQPDRWVVLSVMLHLSPVRTGPVRYAELAGILGVPVGASADVEEIRAAVLLLRRRKGMVLDEADHDTWSAGSFFTNPVVVDDSAIPAECPRYPSEAGVKLSAAWLIEQSGIHRGFGMTAAARARVSTKHTLALTNLGGASAAELLALAHEVQRRVQESFGVELAFEPTLVGVLD